ncbi:hypothetical protein TcCL_ESM06205 [Trypanosoma cruzi]|nr:hypothetical protein TcCL_ESM06205 [Trypanosoma cruzi]
MRQARPSHRPAVFELCSLVMLLLRWAPNSLFPWLIRLNGVDHPHATGCRFQLFHPLLGQNFLVAPLQRGLPLPPFLQAMKSVEVLVLLLAKLLLGNYPAKRMKGHL